jgi:hypothetical protein
MRLATSKFFLRIDCRIKSKPFFHCDGQDGSGRQIGCEEIQMTKIQLAGPKTIVSLTLWPWDLVGLGAAESQEAWVVPLGRNPSEIVTSEGFTASSVFSTVPRASVVQAPLSAVGPGGSAVVATFR